LCDKLTIYFGDKKKSPPKPKTPTVPADVKKPAVAPMVGLGGNIDRIIAEGGVEIINKKDKTRAVGGHAVYTSKTEILVLTVNPKLYTKQGILLAKVIEYNRLTGELSARQAVLENENKPKVPNNKPSSK
jgi:lipopolysaccharide export system protein LptA